MFPSMAGFSIENGLVHHYIEGRSWLPIFSQYHGIDKHGTKCYNWYNSSPHKRHNAMKRVCEW